MNVENINWVCKESFGQVKKQGNLREEGLFLLLQFRYNPVISLELVCISSFRNHRVARNIPET